MLCVILSHPNLCWREVEEMESGRDNEVATGLLGHSPSGQIRSNQQLREYPRWGKKLQTDHWKKILLLSIAQDCWGWRDFKERFLEDQEWNCWKGKEYGWYQEEDIGCRALYCSNKQEYCYPKLQSGGKSRKYHHNPTFTQPWIICNSPIGIHPRTDWHESDKNLNFLDIRQLPVLNKLLWNTICRKKSLPISRWVRWFSEMD